MFEIFPQTFKHKKRGQSASFLNPFKLPHTVEVRLLNEIIWMIFRNEYASQIQFEKRIMTLLKIGYVLCYVYIIKIDFNSDIWVELHILPYY